MLPFLAESMRVSYRNRNHLQMLMRQLGDIGRNPPRLVRMNAGYGSTNSKAAKGCGTGGFAFPHTRHLRVPLRRASLGIRTGSTCRRALSPQTFRRCTRTTPVRPGKHTTSPAHFLWLTASIKFGEWTGGKSRLNSTAAQSADRITFENRIVVVRTPHGVKSREVDTMGPAWLAFRLLRELAAEGKA